MKIVVAISSFRSDSEAIRLVSELYSGDYEFSNVVVVCSAGGHDLAKIVNSKGYRNCQVSPFDNNLGSAGNLYERFKLANELGGDFMLALNHDAQISPQMFRTMVDTAENCDSQIGALYPLRYKSGKQQYDLTGTRMFPFRFLGAAEVPSGALIDVSWSSSNGALYALAPFRAGVSPDISLWMGWEDYLYGLQLRDAGYRQCIVTSAHAVDGYEYKVVKKIGMKVTISDKPLWYTYYGPRNMVLICAHRYRTPEMLFFLMLWIISFPAHIFFAKAGMDRWHGLRYFVLGLAHGLLNSSGKWRLP